MRRVTARADGGLKIMKPCLVDAILTGVDVVGVTAVAVRWQVIGAPTSVSHRCESLVNEGLV